MTFISTQLETFFEDFNFNKEGEQIYFDALVKYELDEKEIKIHSKVAVVTSSKNPHDTIFLLNTYLNAAGFPDVFRTDRDMISYCSGHPLKIMSCQNKTSSYKVIIEPLCNQ